MSWAKEIKRKIASIKNTWKITKAMELISTVKMKKAQDLALEKRDFVIEMLKIFLRIEDYLSDYPLFKNWKWDKTLWVIITSNKWLCWGYNVNVMKKVNSYMKETWENLDFVTIWKKWAQFVVRTWNNLVADFSKDFADNVSPFFTKDISRFLRDEFLSWKYSKVVIFYSFFVNTIKQIPVVKVSLPISYEEIKKYLLEIVDWHFDMEAELKKNENIFWYDVEPSPEAVVNEVIPIILDMMFYDVILDAKASEHSARMIAMKNAKESSNNIADNLTLQYNKARQAIITKEVSEIVSWVETLKD